MSEETNGLCGISCIIRPFKGNGNARCDKIANAAEWFYRQCLGTMWVKSNDYTAASETDPWLNFRSCGWKGIIPRIGDKYMRLVAVFHGVEMQVEEDKLESDLIDLANYAMIMYSMIQEEKQAAATDTPREDGET